MAVSLNRASRSGIAKHRSLAAWAGHPTHVRACPIRGVHGQLYSKRALVLSSLRGYRCPLVSRSFPRWAATSRNSRRSSAEVAERLNGRHDHPRQSRVGPGMRRAPALTARQSRHQSDQLTKPMMLPHHFMQTLQADRARLPLLCHACSAASSCRKPEVVLPCRCLALRSQGRAPSQQKKGLVGHGLLGLHPRPHERPTATLSSISARCM